MELINISKKQKMMDYIKATATAESENDVQALLEVFNPTTRKDTGEKFEEAIGYDPISYFDISDVIAALNSVMDNISRDGVDIIMAHRDEIVEKAMSVYDDRREQHLKDALAVALCDWLNGDDVTNASLFLTGEATPIDALADDDEDDDDSIVSDDIASELEDDDDIHLSTILDEDDDDDMIEIDEEDDDE